jgi:hypothetical protein
MEVRQDNMQEAVENLVINSMRQLANRFFSQLMVVNDGPVNTGPVAQQPFGILTSSTQVERDPQDTQEAPVG